MSKSDQTPASELSIGDVVKATGVGEATLRAWERRFGFPEPQRQPSGHRRYSATQVDQVARVLAERERGTALPVAIERARGAVTQAASLFAHMRELRPELAPLRIRKRHLVRFCHAIEDESAARAERALLIGSFEQEAYYRQNQARWRQLARGAELAFVFAQFERQRRPRGGPVEIPIDSAHPLAREWGLICLGPEHRVCLLGWEPPAATQADDGERVFEVLYSVDPAVVRQAAEAAVAIAAPLASELAAAAGSHIEALATPAAESQLRLSTAITARFLATLG